MLETLAGNAERLGLEVATRPADAEQLPFEDESFDLVFGHAVLRPHPRPVTGLHRVQPRAAGGTLLFAGDALALRGPHRRGPKALGRRLAPFWRMALRAGPAAPPPPASSEAPLEPVVDVHAFSPVSCRDMARDAGFEHARVGGEELVANLVRVGSTARWSSANPTRSRGPGGSTPIAAT